MDLDRDTLDALGFGDHWTQLALCFGLYAVVSTRRDWRKGRTSSAPTRTAHALTTSQRREATRRRSRGDSYASIARAVGAGEQSVRAYLAPVPTGVAAEERRRHEREKRRRSRARAA